MASIAVRRGISALSRKGRQFSTVLVANEEFPGLPDTTPETANATSASVTKLSSGLTVVSEDASSTSTVTMTFPKGGSGSEQFDEQGAALINKCLAFNSGSGLSTVMILRSIENEGAIPFASVDRDFATVGYTVEPDNAQGLIPLLATDCTFEKWDVRDAKILAAYQAAQANKIAQEVLTEQIYAAAYGAQSPMGRPLYCTDAGAYEIASFRTRAYGLDGAILTATGIKDHATFCSNVEELFSEAPAGSSDAAAEFAYIGGEARIPAPIEYAHLAIAFGSDASTPLRNVLKHCFSIAGKEGGVSGFATKGLVGVYGGAVGEGVGALDSAITEALTSKLTADTINKAKTAAKAEALFGMDCGSKGLAATMTASVMESGSFSNATALAAEYDVLSESDVNGAIAAALKSNPSLAAIGDISDVPYQGTFATRF